MGLEAENVLQYERLPDPTKELIYDWSCRTKDPTVKHFISLLNELERCDVVSEIHAFFKIPESNENHPASETASSTHGSHRNRHASSADNETLLTASDNTVHPLRLLQVDTQDSGDLSSSTSQRPGSASSQTGGASYVNEFENSGINRSITDAKRGVSNLTVTDEGVGYSVNVGVTLNRVEGRVQPGAVAEHNITPVE